MATGVAWLVCRSHTLHVLSHEAVNTFVPSFRYEGMGREHQERKRCGGRDMCRGRKIGEEEMWRERHV